MAWDDSDPCVPQSPGTPFHYGAFDFIQSTLILPSLRGKLSFLDNYYLMYRGLRSGKGRLKLVKDNGLASRVYIVTLQCGHSAYWPGITRLHVGNGLSLAGKDWRFLNTVFSGVNVVGAVFDSNLGGIRDCQFLVSSRGPWHRLRTCIIPVKILGSTNSKPGVPWLTIVERVMVPRWWNYMT